MKKNKVILVLSICFALAFSCPVLLHAQDGGNAVTTTADDDDDDDDANYGWIGLIGLAGLLGLKKKDRDHHDDRVRTGATTR